MNEPEFPGAVAPERQRTFLSHGVPLHLSEWGDPGAVPVLLCHGMFDHGRGFDLIAPHLAQRYRVIALDSRGHGESGWADAYNWPSDVNDVVNVLRSLGRPAHLIGHSRGGGQVTDAAAWAPDLVRAVVNIDGFGPPPEGFQPTFREFEDATVPRRFAEFLEWRRRTTTHSGWRPYATLEDLVERRLAQNPRLSREWLRYFSFHAARHDERGWTWKADPQAGRGFGPWRPEWIAPLWTRLRAPLLAVIGSEPDTWGPLPEEILEERLAHAPILERATVQGAGHFVHMERPVEMAKLALGFLETR